MPVAKPAGEPQLASRRAPSGGNLSIRKARCCHSQPADAALALPCAVIRARKQAMLYWRRIAAAQKGDVLC